MDKPEDIPQDVWDRSETVIIDLEEHVDFSNDGRITDKYMDRQYAKAQAIIARAIMAAKAEESDACAKKFELLKYTPNQGIDGEMEAFNDGVASCIRLVKNRELKP